MRQIVLDTDVASLIIKRRLPSTLLRELIGSQTGITCCLAFDLPLATRNVEDFRDFAEHEGLMLVGT